MTFNQAIIDKLSINKTLQNELSVYNGKLAIFYDHIPFDANFPCIKFYTSKYSVPTTKQTVLLTLNYYKFEIVVDNVKHIMFEIVNCLDNIKLHATFKDDLRIYLASNPVYLSDRNTEKSNHAAINFIVRGAIKQWGID